MAGYSLGKINTGRQGNGVVDNSLASCQQPRSLVYPAFGKKVLSYRLNLAIININTHKLTPVNNRKLYLSKFLNRLSLYTLLCWFSPCLRIGMEVSGREW
jgi:hypothetical protein